MTEENDDLISIFLEDARDALANVEQDLLAIEQDGAGVDIERVNQLFRALHSVKGGGSCLGLKSIAALAHEMESVLNLVRNGRLVPTGPVVEALLGAADALSDMIAAPDASNDVDVTAPVQALQSAVADAQEAAPPAETESSAPQPSGEHHAHGASDTSLRVPITVLDSLMSLAGELVLGRNQLLQTVADGDPAALHAVSAQLNRITTDLQDVVMRTRMQPIGSVFARLPRMARDLAHSLDKQVQLVLEGDDVELDKAILEAIVDPLTHLLRNAIDHGLETPQRREELGKNPTGQVVIRAFHQAGKVRLSIHDDGQGLNADRIRAKAVERGMLTSDQAAAMRAREAFQLIFEPGFSTASEVSTVSGRGVGMDVVRNNVEHLGGTVAIDSEPSSGTAVEITLPLTLAILPSLIVTCSGWRYAIPQTNVAELVRVPAGRLDELVQSVMDSETLRLRDTLLPLLRLPAVLGQGADQPGEAMTVLVIEAGPVKYGLAVDAVSDTQEIVVKPLGRHVRNIPCLAGATVLGDGAVAMILDAAGIAQAAGLRITEDIGLRQRHQQRPKVAKSQNRLLLLSTGPDDVFAVDARRVQRIERAPADRVRLVGDRELLVCGDRAVGLVRLSDSLRTAPPETNDRPYVVVVRTEKGEFGLLAPRLGEFVTPDATIDANALSEKGVAGCLQIDGTTVRLLDVDRLCAPTDGPASQVPERSPTAAPPAATAGVASAKRVLVVEDSNFFRQRLGRILAEDGYEIAACCDGQEAWDLLRSGKVEVDLIVTDIEMPAMDGLSLTRRIRSEPALAHLPVIAVTSLAGQADQESGIQAGVNEYHVKMDADELREIVARLLSESAGEVSR